MGHDTVTPKVIVEVPKGADSRWKAWAKVLTGVNQELTNGYSFVGDFIKIGRKRELEIGSIILFYNEVGSTKHHSPDVTIYEVQPDGTLKSGIETSGWDWALDIRDEVAKLFESTTQVNALSLYTTDDLVGELIRRGFDAYNYEWGLQANNKKGV